MNRRMTWDEMVREYPDRWVVVEDAEKNGPDVLSGKLVAVITDEEIGDYQADNLRKGYDFRRTTSGHRNKKIYFKEDNICTTVSTPARCGWTPKERGFTCAHEIKRQDQRHACSGQQEDPV